MENLLKDVDYIVLVDKEKKARLDNEFKDAATYSNQIVRFFVIFD